MEESKPNENTNEIILISDESQSILTNVAGDSRKMSQNLFPDSPVYESEETQSLQIIDQEENILDKPITILDDSQTQCKRKLSSDTDENPSKIPKLDIDNLGQLDMDQGQLDKEVSDITDNVTKRKITDELAIPSTSRVRTPVRSSPRITKRSNSSTEVTKTPKKTPKRSGSADITRKTPQKNSKSKSSSTEDISIKTPKEKPPCQPIAEESDLNDSQNLHLVLSPSLDSSEIEDLKKSDPVKHSSAPVVAKDRNEILVPGKVDIPRSEGYNYSDMVSNVSQLKDFKGKTTDQDSTDSVGSMLDSPPDKIPTVASRLISKLSNGNSSTPTEISNSNSHLSDSDSTPDMIKLNGVKNKQTNEGFRANNTTTPSTISPLQNGHSIPLNTPQIPTFDFHINHDEDGEFLSLYIVRTDNDLGVDMCKEYQRFSKRFTIDPYLADVSNHTSPSSVTSTGMINLPNRASFASTVSSSSTSSSNRTSDGTFVVPQPPKKSGSNTGPSAVKGYEALMKKLQDIFCHMRESVIDDVDHSNDDKISIGIQASPSSSSHSNGNASPGEIANYDKTTPKSSLKKRGIRGRRPLTGKTKRAILPTQIEEPEYMHGMSSPEMITLREEVISPIVKDEKPIAVTPKSVSKLKQKRSRPTSPRPATPVEKAIVKPEYSGFPPDTVVLARWVDKRYYSGKVLEITEPNKYLIKFDDGKSKALLDDFIIFGDQSTLPLVSKSVFALVDKHSYEPALVLSIDQTAGGEFKYSCMTDGDKTVSVPASDLYLTEDQARCIKESTSSRSPPSTPSTPRRRGLRELDLDNIIQGPRSARNKATSSAKKRVDSPKSPKASTSGVKPPRTPVNMAVRKRVPSSSSSVSDGVSGLERGLDHVEGVEPEVQRTGVHGVKANPLQLKGATKQNIGKKNVELTKLENKDTINLYGPIPQKGSKLFAGLHFLLTCAETIKRSHSDRTKNKPQPSSNSSTERQDSSEEDSSMAGTDCEDLQFSHKPFHKERLREQLEAGGGIVYNEFKRVPKDKYSSCLLIAPRPCLTAKYILCVASNICILSHDWVTSACERDSLPADQDAYSLPAGWSILTDRFVRNDNKTRNTSIFKDKVILLCSDSDTFVEFWKDTCRISGATTRVVTVDNMDMAGAIALVTEVDCPHEVQNKANSERIPLVSTTWVVQSLLAERALPPTQHDQFSFTYTQPQ